MKLAKKYELMILRLSLLEKEYGYEKEASDKAQDEFQKHFQSKISNMTTEEKEALGVQEHNGVYRQKPKASKQQPKTEQENEQVQSAAKERPAVVKKVFKDIAKKTHPDILSGDDVKADRKKELFRQAQAAAEESNIGKLHEIAVELGVELPDPDEKTIDLLQKSISTTNKKIKELKKTFIWLWYNSPNKDQIMERFIERLKNANSRT